jgi:hypothetical protein
VKLTALYQRYAEVYPTLFTNVNNPGAVPIDGGSAFCQEGIFPANNTRFLFCAMHTATYFGTVAVGYPPANALPPGASVNIPQAMSVIQSWAQRVAGAYTP